MDELNALYNRKFNDLKMSDSTFASLIQDKTPKDIRMYVDAYRSLKQEFKRDTLVFKSFTKGKITKYIFTPGYYGGSIVSAQWYYMVDILRDLKWIERSYVENTGTKVIIFINPIKKVENRSNHIMDE